MENLELFTDYCLANAKGIFVRDKAIDGKFASYALAEFTPERQTYWISYWWKENRTPIVMKLEKDQEEG